jgi:hypothetical protein
VEDKTDKAVAVMKTTRVYPLAKSANPPAMTFVNGSHQEIDTLFSDSGQFFDDLAGMIEYEPPEVIPSHERFRIAAIGIEKGKPFRPDAQRRKLLGEAAYPDRVWEWRSSAAAPRGIRRAT